MMTSGGETAPGEFSGPGSGGGGRQGGARWLGGIHWRGIARPRLARRELTLALILGVAGAALIFLATRQAWAQVRTAPPRPLPASLITVTGAALVPYADALTLASLASLAAVVASRRLLRRLIGVLLAVLGAALATSVVSVSRAGAIAAAAASTNPATAGAGSVTQGSAPTPSGIPNVAGASSHVTFIAAGWQVLAMTGAIVLVAAGVLVLWRANRMAVMSSRYDAPSRVAKNGAAVPATQVSPAPVPPARVPAGPVPPGPVPPAPAPGDAGLATALSASAVSASAVSASAVSASVLSASTVRRRRARPGNGHKADPGGAIPQAGPARPVGSGRPAEPATADSASMWEALSRGDDPTSAAAQGGDGNRHG
jgi:uncharacterized membrane protein (TIGR02234 family)